MINPHQLVAHRGYQKHFPENTLLSIRKAIEAGALFVECDVQLSADAIPLIYHDPTLRRLSGQSGLIVENPWEQLSALTAHEPGRFGQRYQGEKIASLAELVSLMKDFPQVHFYVELKEEAIAHHGARFCLQQIGRILQPVIQQCTLISFNLPTLKQAKSAGFLRIGPVLRNWATRDQVIVELEASVMFINKNRIPEGIVIAASCPVVVYEVDGIAEAQRWLQRGAAKIETFAAGELLGVA